MARSFDEIKLKIEKVAKKTFSDIFLIEVFKSTDWRMSLNDTDTLKNFEHFLSETRISSSSAEIPRRITKGRKELKKLESEK